MEQAMIVRMIALVAVIVSLGAEARAQAVGTQSRVLNLSGVYRCVRACVGRHSANIAQVGWELHLTNEIGQPGKAYIDWPGHIVVQSWNEGAVYSPDGFTIQFDSGAVWVLICPTPTPGWRD
jgi:hypothetical protein